MTNPKIPEGPETAPQSNPAGRAIPLPQIADRAKELHSRLVGTYQQLSSTQEVLPSESVIQKRAQDIRERALYVDALIKGIPTSMDLRDEDQYWVSLNRQFTSERKSLTSQANSLGDQIQFLDREQSVWQATLDQIRHARGIQGVVDRVQQELNAIGATRNKVQEQLNLVLTLQNQISQQDQQITEVLDQLSQARAQMRGQLFERDGQPIWKARELRSLDRPMTLSVHGTINRELKGTGDLLGSHKLRALFALALYGLSLFSVFKLRAYIRGREEDALPPQSQTIRSRPYSVALVVALLATIGRFQSTTSGIVILFALLWLIPTLRLLPPLIGPGPRSLFHAFLPILLLEGARILIPFSTALKRDLFVLNMVLALILLAFLIRPTRLRHWGMDGRNSRLLILGVRAGIVLLAVSIISNFFGFLSLSQVLGVSVFFAFFGGAALYNAARVLTLILMILLRTDWTRVLLNVRLSLFERWAGRILASAAILVWLNGLLQVLTIHDLIFSSISDVLNYSLGYGNLRFTLGGFLSVSLIVLVGFFLARVFTFILKRFLLPIMPLQRGVAHAVSTVTYYVLLVLVAIVSLAAAGVELNKFTVLTGALGVGLGFGLQNVVNNFVSGLILLFERPIHLNDTVEVGGLVGTVRRIGARSSTILTFQGAEVIVPNSNLLSNQVVNWTLSSQWRRVDVPIRVAYGTDPERLLRLLVEVAESNPRVLRERPPAAFFLGFGDSALNFELRFWSADQDSWFQLQSEVVIAVARALQNAEIEIPFPQQDLHVRSVDASIGAILASEGARPTKPAYAPMPEHSKATSSQSHHDPRQK
jgi:potassium-dependent mechanosensitive channel